MLNNLTLQD